MNNKYTFIHPTKSGGTAVENYFSKHYKDYITGTGHETKCTNTNNPIIIIRDVKSRFYSMYKYWKNGSIDSNFKRSSDFKEIHKSISILDFIDLLKYNKEKLYHGFTWNQYFENTNKWIGDTDYKNIIIIKYCNDLNDKIQKLINYLNIPNKNIPLTKYNVSVDMSDQDKLLMDDVNINEFIEDYFKDDIKLINIIENNPEQFKLVI